MIEPINLSSLQAVLKSVKVNISMYGETSEENATSAASKILSIPSRVPAIVDSGITHGNNALFAYRITRRTSKIDDVCAGTRERYFAASSKERGWSRSIPEIRR